MERKTYIIIVPGTRGQLKGKGKKSGAGEFFNLFPGNTVFADTHNSLIIKVICNIKTG
jgi:hypothetical protein